MVLQAQEELQLLLDSAPAFIISVDPSGAIRFINRVLPGFDKGAVIGTSWLNYIVPGEHAAMAERLASVLQSGTPIDYDVSVSDPGGAMRFFASQMSPLRQGDEITGAVIISQDVTELRRVEAELASAQRLATVGTLAAGVAHEINTPIQFVSDNMQFLRDATTSVFGLVDALYALHDATRRRESAEQLLSIAQRCDAALEAADLEYVRTGLPDAIEACLGGLERVANIVRSLKEFAHPARPDMTLADLNRAICSTVTVATNEFRYVADLELDLADLPQVSCHLDEINQVVLNIIVNAAHAIGEVVQRSGERGTITVRTRSEGPNVLIAISDTGTGIPSEVQPRIFDPFFTTKEVGRGTGQGLAIARTIVVNRHRGELTFETAPGHGTTFFIRLPIDPDARPPRPSPPPE